MKDLIEALKIFEKYIGDEKYPTWAEHDEFGVNCPINGMSEEDIKKLDELVFFGLVNMNVLFLLNMVVVRR